MSRKDSKDQKEVIPQLKPRAKMSLFSSLSPRAGANIVDIPSPRKKNSLTSSSVPTNTPVTVLKGNVWKKRKGKGPFWGSGGDWKRVYIVLKPDVLEYYHNEHLYVLHAPPHQKWQMSKVRKVLIGVDEGEKSQEELPEIGFAFRFLTTELDDERQSVPVNGGDVPLGKVIFGVPTKEERDEWIKSLNDAMEGNKWKDVEVIGKPTGFKHNVHLTTAAGAALTVPSEWIDLMKIGGLTIEDIQNDPEGTLAVLDFASKDLVAQPPQQQQTTALLQQMLDTHVRMENPVPHFHRMTQVAEGGFGKVFLGTRVHDDRTVAIKVIPRTPKTNMQRLLNEIAMMYILRDHPNIVHGLDTFVTDKEVWVIMEYMFGGCLTDILLDHGPLKEPEIAYICREVLKGLSFMHHRFRIHRDIKSDNILLGLDGEVKLADFGFTAQLTAEVEARSSKVGTNAWMAPEVIQQQQYGESADVWSFGMLCLEMAEQEPPYLNLPQLQRFHKIVYEPSPTLKNPKQWTAEFLDFVNLCLIKEPDSRATVDQLLYHTFIRSACTKEDWLKCVKSTRKHVLKKSVDKLSLRTPSGSVLS